MFTAQRRHALMTLRRLERASSALVVTVGIAASAVMLPAGSASAEDYTFVSLPDFLNQDVADVPAADERCALSWRQGDPTSTTPQYEAELAEVLAGIKDKSGATDALVAGDMVEGRWGKDTENTGIFGSLGTYIKGKAALRRAACTYYPAWKARFDVAGLTPYTALGDHEVGDGHWNVDTYGPYARFKHRAQHVFKNEWARYLGMPEGASHPAKGPAQKTAYATYLRPEVLLVDVDVFKKTDNDVVIDLDDAQQHWLNGVLRQANQRSVNWIIVQGHVPVLKPVRHSRSSIPRLEWTHGAENAFWQSLERYDVDLYLTGEVHATTMRQHNGVTQLSHGGLFYKAEFSYLTATVGGGQIALVTRAYDARMTGGDPVIWQTDRRVGREGVEYGAPHVTGRATLTENGDLSGRNGLLKRYTP